MGKDAQAARKGQSSKASVEPAVVKGAADTAKKAEGKKARQVPPGTMSATPKMEEPKGPAVELPPEAQEEQRKADRRADDLAKNDAMAKFVEQQSGTKPAVDMEAFKAELAALQAKFGVKADVKLKAARSDKIVQNGVTRPAAGTTCGKIWAIADSESQRIHGVASVALIREHAEMKGVNDHTIKTQYAKWRAFNNISGRLPRIQAVHQVQGVYNEALPNVVGGTPAPEAITEDVSKLVRDKLTQLAGGSPDKSE